MGLLPNLQARFARLHDQVLVLQQRAYERGGLVSGLARSARLMIQAGVMALGALLVLRRRDDPRRHDRQLDPAQPGAGADRADAVGLAVAGPGRRVLAAPQVLLAHVPPGTDALPLPAPLGAVALEQVSFDVDQRAILRPTSFAVEPGEFLGIVGPSGAGKSTLCRLMIGVLKPTGGTIRLDGVDIATQSRDVLGPYVGYLPQHTGLFAGTVAENIARMAIRPEPEAVVAAAKAAGVHELILRLPKGYDTELGEDGAPLSAGQRQRLGLARTIYGLPKLVVLDEPNAHLDGAGEQALAGALRSLKEQNATVVLVTHRLNILRHADRIMVMENGGIERIGGRDKILGGLVRPARAA